MSLYTIGLFEGKYILLNIDKKELTFMLVDFIWSVFKSTGSVDSYVLMKEIEEKYKSEKTEDVVREEIPI